MISPPAWRRANLWTRRQWDPQWHRVAWCGPRTQTVLAGRFHIIFLGWYIANCYASVVHCHVLFFDFGLIFIQQSKDCGNFCIQTAIGGNHTPTTSHLLETWPLSRQRKARLRHRRAVHHNLGQVIDRQMLWLADGCGPGWWLVFRMYPDHWAFR